MPRPDGRTTRNALGRIQRLCCLGLGGEVFVPELLREMQPLIAFTHGFFWWAGPNCEVANMYTTAEAATLLPVYLREFHNRREREVMLTFTEAMRAPWPGEAGDFYERTLKVDRGTFLRSDLYNLILRPLGAEQMLILRVREPGRPLGSLQLGRAAGDAPFVPDDHGLLESISRFVAHGMTRAPDAGTFADSEERALFIADRHARVRHAGTLVQHLLMMALNPRWSPGARWRSLRDPVPELARLCGALAAAGEGEIGQPPPVLRRRNAWGEFVLRAYWLGPTDGVEQTRHIGITIERRVPRALAVWRRVEQLPLTPREKQLCLLLARDPSRDDLAEAMGLGASTVATHLRSVHGKLGVHSRAELLAALQPA